MTIPSRPTDNFRHNLRHAFKSSARGLQSRMSASTGISNPTLSAMVSDGLHGRKATINQAASVAEFLGVTIDALIRPELEFQRSFHATDPIQAI